MPNQKSSDYKETAVQYYLAEDKSQEEVCKIFKNIKKMGKLLDTKEHQRHIRFINNI